MPKYTKNDCPDCDQSGTCWPEYEGETECVCCLRNALRACLVLMGGVVPYSDGAWALGHAFRVRAGLIPNAGGRAGLWLTPIGELASKLERTPEGGVIELGEDRIGLDALGPFRDVLAPKTRPNPATSDTGDGGTG